MPSVINTLVDETANLGKVTVSITLIISIIIAVILIICAIVIGTQPKRPYTSALITSATCNTYYDFVNNRTVVKYSCILKLKYNINNIEYLNSLTTNSSTVYNPNTYIDIEYDINNPNIPYIKGLDNSIQSFISVGIAAAIVIFAFLNYYLTSKSKVWASYQGVSALSNGAYR
jgi:hypothetical protein